MSQTIAVINQKGGVGKTTTVINLAAFLRKLKKRVLIIDIDPQGNASSGLGLNKQSIKRGVKDVLVTPASLRQIVVKVESGIELVPTNQSLAAMEIELVKMNDREQRLKQAIASADYDYIIIDCPPSLSLLTVNALTAANSVLIPVQAEYYALEGLSQLLEVIGLVRDGLNPNLDLLGVLITMYDGRTSLSEQVKAEVENYFGDKVFKTIIPRNVRLAEAPSHGQTICNYDKWSKGARAYKLLAKEVVTRIE